MQSKIIGPFFFDINISKCIWSASCGIKQNKGHLSMNLEVIYVFFFPLSFGAKKGCYTQGY